MSLRVRGIGDFLPGSRRRAPILTDVPFPQPFLMFLEFAGKKSRPPGSPLRLL